MSSKTLSQEDLNALLANERRTLERKHKTEIERLTQELAASAAVADASRARVAELEGNLANLTLERDAIRGEYDAALASHAETVSAFEQRHAETVAGQRKTSAEATIAQALTGARVVPEAMKFAADQLLRESTIEHDDSHAVAAVTYGGKRYASAGDAAKAFLEQHLFLAQAPAGGSGTPRDSGLSSALGQTPVDITKMDPMALADEGWRTPH